MTKEYVLNYLRINAISSSLRDEEIALQLKNIGWQDTDIDESISILRDREMHQNNTEDISTVLYKDAPLSRSAVLSYLNIHVQHSKTEKAHDEYLRAKTIEKDFIHTVGTFLLAIIVAGVTSTIAMFMLKIGPFYSMSY